MPSNHAYGSVKSCKMRFLATSILLIASVGLSACANLSTVSRTTWLWPLKNRAIHLDAQQRLVLVRADKYCAEPSPDALASYAAALSLSVRKPGAGAVSLAQSLQSNAASIGLRTQSITLMRDALYRMCEASSNGDLNQLEVVAFLRRSQALTAVVLAIEQLTGAVGANQAILTPDANASASANLISNQQLLDQAEQNVQAKQEAVTTAEKTLTERKTARETARSTRDQENESAKQGEPKSEETATKKAAVEQANKELQTAEDMASKAENNLKRAQQSLTEAKEVRDAIRASREAALTNLTAETSSSGQFSTPVQRNLLSTEATKEIATAVKEMVFKVLESDDMDQICLSYLVGLQLENIKRERSAAHIPPEADVIALCLSKVSSGAQEAVQSLYDSLVR